MATIHVGCAGYSYADWKGGFYPKTLDPNQYLTYYAKFFDFTEINSTFYSVPPEKTVRHWYDATPPGFKFAIKVWQGITHTLHEAGVEEKIDAFFNRIQPLRKKISIYLLQFPPFFKYSPKHLEQLKEILSNLPKQNRYAIELRENAWFGPDTFGLLKEYPNAFIVTSYLEKLTPVYLDSKPVLYIRAIGDRSLTHYNKIQRPQDKIFTEILQKVSEFQKTPTLTDIFVIFNNHFRGFSPQDVNDFKQKMGLGFKNFAKNRSLIDFMG
jgi:uncharacterized protein YecE (DUF72 family)